MCSVIGAIVIAVEFYWSSPQKMTMSEYMLLLWHLQQRVMTDNCQLQPTKSLFYKIANRMKLYSDIKWLIQFLVVLRKPQCTCITFVKHRSDITNNYFTSLNHTHLVTHSINFMLKKGYKLVGTHLPLLEDQSFTKLYSSVQVLQTN